MSLDYNTIYEAYQGYMNGAVFPFIVGVKGIALIMILFSWYNKYTKSLRSNIGTEKLHSGISANDIVMALVVILALGMYDKILESLDSILMAVESQYRDFQVNIAPLEDPEELEDYDTSEMGWSGALKLMAGVVIDSFLAPGTWVLGLLGGLAWILDILIYAIFLGERFFILGILRILGGLAIACYPIERLRSWFWNWVKLYTGYYLMMIPFFLIVGFTNYLSDYLQQSVFSATYSDQAVVSVEYIILILGVWLKYRLFRGAREVTLKLFN